MNLRELALLADENIHPDVVLFLRGEGFDVLDVKESGLIGSPDVVLLRKSLADRRVILTHDSDFGTLAVAAHEPFFGIVYLRPGHILPTFTIETLRTVLDQSLDLAPPFIVVSQRIDGSVKIRVRLFPIS